MSISDKVETTRGNVMEMINCRFDYGHANQITDHFFWSLLGKELSDDDIRQYADDLISEDGYTQEDWDCAIEQLTQWRDAQRTIEEQS